MLHRRREISGWVSQKLFNNRTKFRHDRIAVLKFMIDLHIRQSNDHFPYTAIPKAASVLHFFNEMYDSRVHLHPKHDIEARRFRLILESLSESGEIIKEGEHEFALSGIALSTVAQYEEDERRHQDSVTHNRRLLFLTVVLAAAALFQAVSKLFQKSP